MKLYNRNLEQIEDKSREMRMQLLLEEVIEFLVNKYEVDRKFLQDKAVKIAFVERNSNESHFVEYNGEKKEINTSSGAASFVTHKKQEYDKEKWEFEDAIYTSDTNSDHTIKHEFFHYFSSVLNMEFNEDGIGYDKSGVQIAGYNKEDKLVDSSMMASGLNEGITELLAQKLDNVSTLQNSYAYQVFLADILISDRNHSLIRAYFSTDEKDFRDFLSEFDKRQSTISSNNLIELLPNDSFNKMNKDLFKGCIEYTLSFCTSKEEFETEKSRLERIIETMVIVDYKNGVNTKEYLLDAIKTIEKNFEEREIENMQKSDQQKQEEKKGTDEAKDETTINNVDIVKMINPDILKQKIKLPNGAKIPVKQYIQEVVAPHIPSSGKFILKSNGGEIPAKQFIEEVVMSVGQEKYNGDINALLEDMTISDTGTISTSTNSKEKIPIGQELKQEHVMSQETSERREHKSFAERAKKNSEPLDNKQRKAGRSMTDRMTTMINVKRSISQSRITKSETQQQTEEMTNNVKVRKLLQKQNSGAFLTEEEKRFIEQHIRETTEAQIRFMNQQNKKRNQGIEM